MSKVKSLSFALGMTIALPNYENIKLDVSVDIDTDVTSKEDITKACNKAKKILFAQLEECSDKKFTAKDNGLKHEARELWVDTMKEQTQKHLKRLGK